MFSQITVQSHLHLLAQFGGATHQAKALDPFLQFPELSTPFGKGHHRPPYQHLYIKVMETKGNCLYCDICILTWLRGSPQPSTIISPSLQFFIQAGGGHIPPT